MDDTPPTSPATGETAGRVNVLARSFLVAFEQLVVAAVLVAVFDSSLRVVGLMLGGALLGLFWWRSE